MTAIWLLGVAVIVIAAIAFCALIISARSDEQNSDELQRDPCCGTNLDDKGHGV